MDDIRRQTHKDQEHSIASVLRGWPIVGKFLDWNGHITMLQLCQGPTTDSYLYQMVQYALGVLYIVALDPTSCSLITDGTCNGHECFGVIVRAAERANILKMRAQVELYHLWLIKSGQVETADILLRVTGLTPLPLDTKK
ncbi:hypothetical protein F511_01384 [Dorcoceras hygrometricum]|uniref:Uncharacterized protein n=1 Tax=Dorcoceras hygrometricum TaxID=472368 RepID=A0A2Z7DBF7_9LAMI|nr:hypothetical protein F511_01384 [Dorcoceras hygrometricum]